MSKVKGTSPPQCKICQERHWGLCDKAIDPKGYLTRIRKIERGRRIAARHQLETEHLAEELDKDIKPSKPKSAKEDESE